MYNRTDEKTLVIIPLAQSAIEKKKQHEKKNRGFFSTGMKARNK